MCEYRRAEKAYVALNYMLDRGSASDDKTKNVVTQYMMDNPVQPGAITEQAQQIEQNKTDVVSLKEDVDFYKGEVVALGKGNKRRTTYRNARSKTLLKQYLASKDDDSEYLFVSERKPHNALKKGAIEKAIRLIGE